MKTATFVAFATLLAASLTSAKTLRHRKRQAPSADQVVAAISHWFTDVSNVNEFLNLAPSQTPISLEALAEGALNNAHDEPNELTVLANLGDALGAPGQQAVLTLQEIFGNVPSSLKNIISDPSNGPAVATQLQQITGVRCCSVLPSLDILWPAAANAVGVADQVNLVVPRPNACLDGTTVC